MGVDKAFTQEEATICIGRLSDSFQRHVVMLLERAALRGTFFQPFYLLLYVQLLAAVTEVY